MVWQSQSHTPAAARMKFRMPWMDVHPVCTLSASLHLLHGTDQADLIPSPPRPCPAGETRSEGGFAPNRVSAASLLDVFESTDKKGKKYYKYEFLVRSADGDEGGRHQLISAAVSNGKLLILKVQAGDKRWIYGVDKDVKETWNSFTVA
jgi:hypothetical protein